MSDEPTEPVSLNKGADDSPAPTARPPRTVMYAVGAMALSGVLALIASVDLYLPSVKHWLTTQRRKDVHTTYKDAIKAAKTAADHKQAASDLRDNLHSLAHDVSATQKGLLISTVVAMVALGFIGYATYRGRYWSRWGVLGLWFLASFTGTLIGIQSALTIASDIPAPYKFPAFLASILLISAVVLTNLRPSVEFFASNRPVTPEGGRGAGRPRRGLFAPPPRDTSRGGSVGPAERKAAAQRAAARKPAATQPADAPDRSKSKQRANTAAVAKGADLARTRAKAAAKSRRTES